MRIKNTSFSATVISLEGGATISLPARGSKDISNEDFKSPTVQRLFQDGRLIILPEGVQSVEEEESQASGNAESKDRNIPDEPEQMTRASEPESGSGTPEDEKATKGPMPEGRGRGRQR